MSMDNVYIAFSEDCDNCIFKNEKILSLRKIRRMVWSLVLRLNFTRIVQTGEIITCIVVLRTVSLINVTVQYSVLL